MEHMGLRAVTLDFGGTLAEGEIDWNEYHAAIHTLLRGLGYSLPLRRVRASISAALEHLRRVRESNRELTLEEVYAYALRRMGIPPTDELLDEIHSLFRQHFRSTPYPCVEDVVMRLSNRYRLAVISNTMSDTPRHVLRSLGLNHHFMVILCSRDLGVRKPDPRIFHHVLQRMDVRPEEAVHVGDSLEADVEGALKAGMKAIWVRGSQPESWSGPTIKTICELPEMLERLGDP